MANYDLAFPGAAIDAILTTAYDLQNAGYIFKGSAYDYTGTPTERTWLIAGEGFTGFGFTTAVPKGCIGLCLYNGSTWSGKVVRVVTIDVAPTSGSTNAVQSGAVYSMVNTVATGISDALNSLTFQETTVSGDEGIKLVESLKMTSQGVTDILTSFTILAATTSKAGLLSASDKAKLDAILTNIRSMVVTDTTLIPNQSTELTESLKWTVGGVQEVISAFTIFAATTSKAGLMSAEDKTKLNTLFADGYKFAGIAVPSSTPMNTTAKIFYIATQAGTYTLFGDITLTDGINILMYNGSAWTSAQLIGIDKSPKPESINLIESGGVFPIKFNASELELLTDFDVINGGYLRVTNIHPEGEFVSNSNYQIWLFPVVPGTCYAFTAAAGSSSTLTFVHWVSGYDTSGTTPIFDDVVAEPYKGNGSTIVAYDDQPIIAPPGAAYCAINLTNARSVRNYIYTSLKLIKDIKVSDIKELSIENQAIISDSVKLDPTSFVSGSYLDSSGEYVELSTYKANVYNVTGGEKYLLSAHAKVRDNGIYVLFWLDDENNVLFYEYTTKSTDENDLILKKQVVIAPENASQAVVNIKTSLETEYSFAELGNYIDIERINSEIRKKADIASISEKVQQEPITVYDGLLFKNSGECGSLSTMEIRKYSVEENSEYSFTGTNPKGISTNFIAWLNSDGDIIDNAFVGFLYAEPYKGSLNEPVSYYQQQVTSPNGAAYAIMNVRKGYTSILYKIGDPVNISDLKSKVDNISRGNMEVTIIGMKSIGGSVVIRTKYNNTTDIVVAYRRGDNDQISPTDSYLGSNTLATSAIMTSSNRFHYWSDSTGPLRNSNNAPWHMFAQHGYQIPLVNCTHSLTDSDIGTVWVDQLNRNYTIGKISGNTLYLLPEVTGPDANGLYTRAWKNSNASDAAIISLSKDGVTLTIDSQSSDQLKPIQESTNFKIIIDGTEVYNDGIFMCNDLILSETLLCYNPFTVQTWFPTPVKNTVAIELTQSYNIHGLSHRYDTILKCIEPLVFTYYGATQAQCLVSGSRSNLGAIATGYTGFVMVPKVKSTVNGNRADIPHITSSDSDDISMTRNSSTLYDVNDQPDREITYMYNLDEGKYLAGFASGLSLLRGASVKAKRNQYVRLNDSCGSMSYSNRNKFYINILIGNSFPNNALPVGLVETFSTYFSYFNPDENKGQVYWYKDGSCYVIYAHYQDANTNIPLKIPTELDGLQVEVIEKTDGVTLVTDNIANGILYVTTDSSDHNYIVLKTK